MSRSFNRQCLQNAFGVRHQKVFKIFDTKNDKGMMSIHLRNLQVEAKKSCGKQPSLSQKISISLKITGNFFACAQDDNIAQTLDYDLFAQKIARAFLAVPCEHEALIKIVHENLNDMFPNHLYLQGNLRLLCCEPHEKPHCFSLTNSLDGRL